MPPRPADDDVTITAILDRQTPGGATTFALEHGPNDSAAGEGAPAE